MTRDFFAALLAISITTGILIFAVHWLTPHARRVYAARVRVFVWLILVIRLLIPVNPVIPRAPVRISLQDEYVTHIAADVDGFIAALTPELAVPPAESFHPQPAFLRGLTFFDATVMLWAGGMFVFLFYHIISYVRFARKILRWSYLPRDPRIHQALARVQERLAIRGQVRLLISSAAPCPMLISMFPSAVVLPRESYSDRQLEFVLTHELIHRKHGDLWKKLLMILAVAIHWFNPLSYLLMRNMQQDIEMACDEGVVAALGHDSSKAYCETIYACLSHRKGADIALATGLRGAAPGLKARFRNILAPGARKKTWAAPIAVLECLIILMAFFTVEIQGAADGATQALRNYYAALPGLSAAEQARQPQDALPEGALEQVQVMEVSLSSVLSDRRQDSLASNLNIPGWNSGYMRSKVMVGGALVQMHYRTRAGVETRQVLEVATLACDRQGVWHVVSIDYRHDTSQYPAGQAYALYQNTLHNPDYHAARLWVGHADGKSQSGGFAHSANGALGREELMLSAREQTAQLSAGAGNAVTVHIDYLYEQPQSVEVWAAADGGRAEKLGEYPQGSFAFTPGQGGYILHARGYFAGGETFDMSFCLEGR